MNTGGTAVEHTLDLSRFDALTFDTYGTLIDWETGIIAALGQLLGDRGGRDPDELLARKSDLVYASLTGYGSRGEDADTPAFDYTAYWARTGLMDLMHDEGTPPAFLRPGVGDHAAGISLVAGILS